MDSAKLRELLTQPEGPTLEFKQAVHIYLTGDGGKRNRHELIKDLLALANGNAEVVAQEKHLIIGASDILNADGTRELFDVSGKVPNADDLLKMLRAFSYPGLEQLSAEVVAIEGKRLLVITVPPTRYIHETTKPLRTPSRSYTEYSVFMRHGENVLIASDTERMAIRRAKRKYFEERRDVPPVAFGAALGALLLSPIGHQQAQRNLPHLGVAGELMGGIIGGLIGVSTGAALGKATIDLKHMSNLWPELSGRQKGIVVTYFGFFIWAYRRIVKWLRRHYRGRKGLS